MGDDEKKNCPDSCVNAGIQLARQALLYPELSTMLWADNVKGLVSLEDLKVPHSELAMHIEAAGSELVAWMVSRNTSHVVWKGKDGCCGYASGLDDELLTPALLKKTREMFPQGEESPLAGYVEGVGSAEWSPEDIMKREG